MKHDDLSVKITVCAQKFIIVILVHVFVRKASI